MYLFSCVLFNRTHGIHYVVKVMTNTLLCSQKKISHRLTAQGLSFIKQKKWNFFFLQNKEGFYVLPSYANCKERWTFRSLLWNCRFHATTIIWLQSCDCCFVYSLKVCENIKSSLTSQKSIMLLFKRNSINLSDDI